jgi:hypothetical protein
VKLNRKAVEAASSTIEKSRADLACWHPAQTVLGMVWFGCAMTHFF